MKSIREMIYFGGDHYEQPVLDGSAEALSLDRRIVQLDGLYWSIGRLPAVLRNRLVIGLIHKLSPYVDALKLLSFRASGRIFLVKHHRSAIAYLFFCYPFFWRKPAVVISWFTLAQRPPAWTRMIYKVAMNRAAAIFIYTPREQPLYSSDFGVDPSKLHLVPLQGRDPGDVAQGREPEEATDVIMTGISGRDWTTFLEVCRANPDLRFTAIGMAKSELGSNPKPSNLTLHGTIDFATYCRLILGAKVVLLLLVDSYGATGQRDLLLLGMLRRAVISSPAEPISYYSGNEGAVRFSTDANALSISTAIRELIDAPELRNALGAELRRVIQDRCSIEHVAAAWAAALADVPGIEAVRADLRAPNL